MKFRITGQIENLDYAAHVPVLQLRGFNHIGVVEPTDTIHRLPILISKNLRREGLVAQTIMQLDETFEMDELIAVSLGRANEDLFAWSYTVDLVDPP